MKPFIYEVQNDVPQVHNKNSKKNRINEYAAAMNVRFGLDFEPTTTCEGDVCKIDD